MTNGKGLFFFAKFPEKRERKRDISNFWEISYHLFPFRLTFHPGIWENFCSMVCFSEIRKFSDLQEISLVFE